MLSRNRNKKRFDRGFTLIEVMIAIFVLAFGLLAMAGVINQLNTSTNTARYNELAAMLATEKLEDLNRVSNVDVSMLSSGGSLTAPTSATYPTSTGNVIVPYYDQVQISTANGTATEYVLSTYLNQNGYWTITHTPGGQASALFTPSSSGTLPNTGAGALTFQRLWTVELNPTVANPATAVSGVRRITVLVTLQNSSTGLGNGASFQATMERP